MSTIFLTSDAPLFVMPLATPDTMGMESVGASGADRRADREEEAPSRMISSARGRGRPRAVSSGSRRA
ncbi:MAG: hypothetical protein VX563_01655, partial [Planctomycetota bacterium]|nr:hypothetical protein [Planctomycetota bacterium]